MADIQQKIVPVKIQLDSDESLRDQFNAAYILNLRQNINRNANAAIDGTPLNQGSNVGAITPIQSPEAICANLELPAGNNICTGAYNSPTTQEIYWENWNDQDNHTVFVFGTETGICRKVYQGACLGFRFEPQFHLPAHRCALFIVYDSDENGNQVIRNKFYVFTDGFNWQFLIDVESAIATDSYNPITFPYFTTFYPHCDPCEAIQLGIRPPQDCPKVLPFDDDTALQYYQPEPENNNLKDKVWYFATSFIDIWGRHSVLSPYSTAVFLDGGDCNADAEDIKCFRLQLDAGSWMVEKIVVYFSNDGINWFKYDEIDKWDDCISPAPEHFWERELALQNYYNPNSFSPPCDDDGCFQTLTYSWDLNSYDIDSASIVINGVTYTETDIASFGLSHQIGLARWLRTLGFGFFTVSSNILTTSGSNDVYGTLTIGLSPVEAELAPTITETDQCGTANTFLYQFCANKQCIPIDPAEVARLFDDLPIASIAQAVIDDKIAYGDNLRGYDNFLCPIGNVEITAVQDTEGCETELVDVIIDMVIHNYAAQINNFIYTPANTTDIAFGGVGLPGGGGTDIVDYEDDTISKYGQQILNPYTGTDEDIHGFIGGMRGTDLKVVSEQYSINDLENKWFFTNVDHNESTRSIMINIINGNFKIQRFHFKNIPKGNYIFEVYSHLATSFATANGTSTYIVGEVNKPGYVPFGAVTVDNFNKEFYINACNGDVEYANYIVLADLTIPRANISIASTARAIAGYLKEKDTNVPVELAYVDTSGTVNVRSVKTDQYGFYFASDSVDFTVDLQVINPDSCTLVAAQASGASANEKQLLEVDQFVDNPANPNFADCGHEIVEGTITDCNSNPIAGIAVVLTQTGQVGISDIDGVYRILAHDNAFTFQTTGETRKVRNEDSLYISQRGACLFSSNCESCLPCIPTTHVTWVASCFHCTTLSPPTINTVTQNFTFDLLSEALKGVKTGGNFAVAIIGYDYLDRNNSAQLIGFTSVPTIQSNGVFAPYHLNWAFNGAMNFPSWVKKIRFAVRGNNNEFLLSWAANKIEFVDSAGNITAAGIATNIKVYIDGLGEFRSQNFFNTNVNYEWLAGDRIRFITNGDGTPFLTADNNGLIDLPVSKVVDQNVLLIPYDPRLENLTANATFDLYRTPVCETEPVYWEQCPSIPVIDGEPTVTSGVIPFFDTYWFFRSIPQTDQNGVPTLFTSMHRYEHHSPSDFWGDHQWAIGRPFVRNENARQTWKITEVAWSDSLLEDGVINGLATWRTANLKAFSVQGSGGIVALRAQTGFLFAVCTDNYFSANIAQNLLIVTPAGNVQATPDYIGNKHQKLGSIYGCAFEDTNTILFIQEWLTFADASRAAWCFSNYQTVWDVTKPSDAGEGGMQSYWIEKFRKIASLRSLNQFEDSFMYLHAGFSIKSNEIVITSFSRGQSPSTIEYGTDAEDYDIDANETVSYNLAGFWSGNYSPTPEAWIEFDSAANGVQLLSFVEGKMWMHNVINPATVSYNNFYGTQYRKIFTPVFNGGQGKNQVQKIFLALRNECKDEQFTCDQATTQTGQLSKIPAEAWERISNYFEAPILMDENSEAVSGLLKLIDGTNLFGTWCRIRMVGEVGKENNYCEITGIIISAVESY